MTAKEMTDRIERDRREREAAVLLLLLALLRKAWVNIVRAIRVGGSWQTVLTGVLLGDDRLDLPGGVGLLSLLMADSAAAGLRRFGRLVGVRLESSATREELVRLFETDARLALERIDAAVRREVERALAAASEADSIAADVRAVGEAFRTLGMTEDAPHGARAEATTAVTVAYAQGMQEAVDDPAVRAVLTALRFVNPLDERTTGVCRVRDGVKLPLDHPWWFRNWPPLHFGCRSIVLPIAGSGVKFTDQPPEVPPPTPGFGRWAGILSA